MTRGQVDSKRARLGAKTREGVLAVGLAPVALSVCFGAAACVPSVASTEVARHGNLPQLKGALAEEDTWSQAKLVQVAHAVLARELTGVEAGEEFLRYEQVYPCAKRLEPLLADRAKGKGVGALYAALLLLRIGVSDVFVPEIGTLQTPAVRHAMLSDPNEGVRLRAALASAVARESNDVGPLLNSVRLDPSSAVRIIGAHALGKVGSQRAVLGLRDQWDPAPSNLKAAILDAWIEPASLPFGGADQLIHVAETDRGQWAVVAAALLEERGQSRPGLLVTALQRALRSDDKAAQKIALEKLSLDKNSALQDAVQQLSLSPSEDVAALALAQLALVRALTPDEQQSLTAISAASHGFASVWAQAALAREGVKSSLDRLRKQSMEEPRAALRLLAARELQRLVGPEAVVHALADDSPNVRTAVACDILAATSSQ